MTLSVTYSDFAPFTTIVSSQMDQNFDDILTWANGNIGADNFATLEDTVDFSLSSNVLALNIANSGTEGSVSINQSGVLASGKRALYIASSSNQTAGAAFVEFAMSGAGATISLAKLTNAGTGNLIEATQSGILASGKSALTVSVSAAQTTGKAALFAELTNASSTIPLIKAENAGSGLTLDLVSTTRGARVSPMTTAQRNAIASPSTGESLYNTSLKRPEVYSGALWDRVGSRKNVVTKTTTYEATADDDVILCTTGSAWTLTLPAAANYAGRSLWIKKTSSDFNALTIATNSTETIDGIDGTTLDTQYESIEIISDGTNWHTIQRLIPGKWTSYTPTCNLTTNATPTGMWKRERDGIRVQCKVAFSGVNTNAATCTFTIPNSSAWTIDTAKLTSSGGNKPLGAAIIADVSTADYEGLVTYASTTTVQLKVLGDGTYTVYSAVSTLGNIPMIVASGDFFDCDFWVPITGLNG